MYSTATMKQMENKSKYYFKIEVSESGDILNIENYPEDGCNLGLNVFIPFLSYAKAHRPELYLALLSAQKYLEQDKD